MPAWRPGGLDLFLFSLMSRTKSQTAFIRAKRLIPGGVNSPARAFGAVGGDPVCIARGEGAYLWDLDDNRYIAVLYFTSESEAREGERKEPPPELRAQMEAMGALEVGEPSFLDLTEPWLYSPR